MLRGRKDDGTWSERDRIMALALTAYEDGLCGDCGGHYSVTHGDHNVGRWETTETICHRCEAADSYRANHKEKDMYPGQKLSLVEVEGF